MKNVCSLITVYKPNIIELKCNIEVILQYASTVYLLFNSPVIDEFQFDKRIISIDNKKNIGISRAINKGIKRAFNDGYQYAVLFDQDSSLTADNFTKMFSELINKTEYQVACIGPSLIVYDNIISIPAWVKNKKEIKSPLVYSVNNIITSGMLVNIEIFLLLKGFNENYPVDASDFLFCWKAVKNNYFVLQSKDAYLIHKIGTHNLKIGNYILHFHAPYRNYFFIRDTLNILFREKDAPLIFRIRCLFQLPFRMLLFLLLLDKKLLRLKMYLWGFNDFIKGRRNFGSIAKILGAD